MSMDQDITDSIDLLQQSFNQAAASRPGSTLKSSIINQPPKTGFKIADATGLKLLLVFNRDTAKCYIKHYYQITPGTDPSCAVCPQEEVDYNDRPKINAALADFIASLP